MEIENTVVCGEKIKKAYKGFLLDVESLRLPKGFATALIGENGAGKTTLLNLMAGLRLDYKGSFTYFDEKLGIDDKGVKEKIGYTGPTHFFMPHWSVRQVAEANELLFEGFDKKKFYEIADALCIPVGNVKNVKSLSEGNKTKLMLATVLARETKLLILDEPVSTLDPLMRDRFCELMRRYISNGDGEKSVFFSTHDIADMEGITDYAIIMEKGKILERGFVEDLKEKYILVKGEESDYSALSKWLIGGSCTKYGFSGLLLSEDLERLSGHNAVAETPSLHQICISVMKQNSPLKMI